jgi:hypothetical protein
MLLAMGRHLDVTCPLVDREAESGMLLEVVMDAVEVKWRSALRAAKELERGADLHLALAQRDRSP